MPARFFASDSARQRGNSHLTIQATFQISFQPRTSPGMIHLTFTGRSGRGSAGETPPPPESLDHRVATRWPSRFHDSIRGNLAEHVSVLGRIETEAVAQVWVKFDFLVSQNALWSR